MSGGGVTLRPYSRADDGPIVELWNAAAGDSYPLRDRLWRQLTADNPDFLPSDIVVAVTPPGVPRGPGSPAAIGPVVGFGYLGRSRGDVVGRRAWPTDGWLQALAVSPGMQRAGIGRAVLERLLEGARADGLERVGVGGGIHYLFPGAPLDLPGATSFLAACGARFGHETFDLRASLDGHATTDRDRTALATAGLTVRPSEPSERAALLAFIDREFQLDWVHDQAWAAAHGLAPSDVLILVPPDAAAPAEAEAIVGFATIHQRGPGPLFGPRFWEDLLEPSSGGLGPIGVAARLRGRGLGRALLAAALDRLSARGVRDCVIDWTTLLDYYGPFGFRPWKTYLQGELTL